MIENVKSIIRHAELIEPDDACKESMDHIHRESHAISDEMRESIIAFQFYDKLSQRLDHVAHALSALAELVDDPARLYNPGEWSGLQAGIRSRYSMREEQEMFDLLLSGASVEEALKVSKKQHQETDSSDDIELF